MEEQFNCADCAGYDQVGDAFCSSCGASLKAAPLTLSADQDKDEEELKVGSLPAGSAEPEDEFSVLDYRPRPKKKLIGSFLLIALMLIVLSGALVFLLSGSKEQQAGETSVVLPKNGSKTPSPDEKPAEEEEAAAGDEETEEAPVEKEEPKPLTPPDYDRLEPDLHRWLVERTGDGNVILLTSGDLEDTTRFFERYDLAVDNIVVYRVALVDEQYVTLHLGPPYSEWSIKAVFVWKDEGWKLLREEDFKPGS